MKVAAVAMISAMFAAAQCAECHAKIVASYSQTAMARSLSQAAPGPTLDDYYHAPSDTHFAMLVRDGKYYQRRWQIGFNGKLTNIEEKSIDFVMGSGEHVKTFLHRTASGELQQLPLAWYSEKNGSRSGRPAGGTWAMNPGYDKPDQPDSRRTIGYECMACHNAVPETPPGSDRFRARPVYSSIPEGIDCQRCHGPGSEHAAKAHSGASIDEIRKAIVNPAKLAPDRQMDMCAQCHLETTSFPFPHSILKYDRGPFSYRPGERLSDTFLIFDKPIHDERFLIVSSVYRLKQSACFLKSAGRLQCTTCHDPHVQESSPDRYDQACRQCHQTLATSHPVERDCVTCHMPKRRTDDVVHAILTDHYIQRRTSGAALLAEKPEPQGDAIAYHGEVVPYDPSFVRTPENELYLALAQVREDNNLIAGVKQFAAAIEKYKAIDINKPVRPEFFVEFGDALLKTGQTQPAIAMYQEALARNEQSVAALLGLGDAFEKAGDLPHAIDAFERATSVEPSNSECWRRLGETQIKLGRATGAEASLKKSLELDPDSAETYYALAMLQSRDPARAETNLRTAIRLQPPYSAAQMNLAILLFRENRIDEARYHFESAIRYHPDYALGHYNYGLMLNAQGKYSEARRELEQALHSTSGLDDTSRESATKVLRELQAR